MKAYYPVKIPHLPKSKIGCVMIGERYREKLEIPLKSRDVEVIWIPDNPNVDPRLCGHADLSAIHMGENKLVVQGHINVNDLMNRGLDVIPAAKPQGVDYPDDAGLNGCIAGGLFIHNLLYTDKSVLKNLGDREIVFVNQGYAKCSICLVDEKSMITSDSGIMAATSARPFEMDVLYIRPGYIDLDGYSCGFIGGSTFKLSEHEMAFTGTLDAHPDKDAILTFLSSKGIRPIFLTDLPIFDIGSAIVVFEV